MRLVHDSDDPEFEPLTTAGVYRDGKLLKHALLMVAMGAMMALVLGLGDRILGPQLPLQGTRPNGSMPKAAALGGAPGAAAKRAPNTLTYRADSDGHFYVQAYVNGAKVLFMVDTGATMVALTPNDAQAAGIDRLRLSYGDSVNTANGTAKVARVSLRDVRLGQLSLEEVPAVVMQQPMQMSLLGMSFLRRLDGYSIRDGVLTIEW